jgi:hypothetical protein
MQCVSEIALILIVIVGILIGFGLSIALDNYKKMKED